MTDPYNADTDSFDKKDADSASAKADDVRGSLKDESLPEMIANMFAEIARRSLQGLNSSISILDNTIVKRLTEAAISVKAVLSIIANNKSLASKVKEDKKRDSDKGKSR